MLCSRLGVAEGQQIGRGDSQGRGCARGAGFAGKLSALRLAQQVGGRRARSGAAEGGREGARGRCCPALAPPAPRAAMEAVRLAPARRSLPGQPGRGLAAGRADLGRLTSLQAVDRLTFSVPFPPWRSLPGLGMLQLERVWECRSCGPGVGGPAPSAPGQPLGSSLSSFLQALSAPAEPREGFWREAQSHRITKVAKAL